MYCLFINHQRTLLQVTEYTESILQWPVLSYSHTDDICGVLLLSIVYVAGTGEEYYEETPEFI